MGKINLGKFGRWAIKQSLGSKRGGWLIAFIESEEFAERFAEWLKRHSDR